MNIGCLHVLGYVLRYWYKNRNIAQQIRVESPEISPHTYDQLIYNKGGKQTQWEKSVSSIIDAGKTGQLYVRKKYVGNFLMPYTKVNSTQINDLNIKPEYHKTS